MPSDLQARPTTKDMLPLAEAWRPHRAVAARVLWTYYRAVKGRDGAPNVPKAAVAPKKSAASKKPAAAKSLKTKSSNTKIANKHREKKHAR